MMIELLYLKNAFNEESLFNLGKISKMFRLLVHSMIIS